MLLLLPPALSVTAPATLLVTLPAPASEPTVSLKPFMSRMPVTVSALASAITSAAPSCSVPAVTVVAPVYVFAPERVSVPAPSLVSASVLVPFCATPENVVEVPLPPALSVIAPAAPLLLTRPVPASEPTVSLKPFMSKVPSTTRALASAMRFAAPSLSVPALTVVAPV